MRPESGHNPARYHWAALRHPLHLGGALLGWATTAGLAITSAGGSLSPELAGWTALGSIAWSGLWLLVLPGTRRFQRLTDSLQARRYENDYTYQLETQSGRVSPALKDKLDAITQLRNRAREILEDKFGSNDPFARDNLDKLDSLAISYLQLLIILTEYDNYLSLVDPLNLEQDIEEARRRLEDATDKAVREARASQVKLLENRLQKYHATRSRLELVREQCHNVETTMKLLVDQAMTAVDPKRVNKDIEQVLDNIRQSETLSDELSAYDDLERELDRMNSRELE